MAAINGGEENEPYMRAATPILSRSMPVGRPTRRLSGAAAAALRGATRGNLRRVTHAAMAALAASWCLGPIATRAAEPMSFAVTELGDVNGVCGRNCVEVISAQGEINNDTADAFVNFLSSQTQDHNLRPVVLLESPGGTVVGSMQLGMVFRKIGAAVIVGSAVQVPGTSKVGLAPGLCMSACVYAFFGGKKRVVPTISRLGIHRMVINEFNHELLGGTTRQQIFGNEEIVSTLAGYTKMMGIDPQVIYYAERVAPEDIHILTQKEIARWRLGSPRL